MNKLQHIEALLRVWKDRADSLEQTAQVCEDNVEQARIETCVESLRIHIAEVTHILNTK
jgi:hypothetical protein